MPFLTVPRFLGGLVVGFVLTLVFHGMGLAPSTTPSTDESAAYRLGYEYSLASVAAFVVVLAFLIIWHKRDSQP